MRKYFLAIWCMCLVLSGCGGTREQLEAEEDYSEQPEQSEQHSPVGVIPPTVDSTEQSTMGWRDAYKELLEEKLDAAVWARDPENPEYDPNFALSEAESILGPYFLYDMDKDGTPELLMRYGGGEASYRTGVYGCENGKAVELGEIPSGHSSFYTCPDETGILRDWGHMGGHFLEKVTLTKDGLETEVIFEEGYAAGDEEVSGYKSVAELVSGSTYLWETRPTVTLPELHVLTLPIEYYGRTQTTQMVDPVEDETARSAIQLVLDGGAEFYGVTADGYGGDTGFINMEDYLQPGGITIYAELPPQVVDTTWEDFNGDGQREALLTVHAAAGDPYGGNWQVVYSWQDDMVYAYCFNYMDSWNVKDNRFESRYAEEGMSFQLVFDKEQVYFYSPEQEA